MLPFLSIIMIMFFFLSFLLGSCTNNQTLKGPYEFILIPPGKLTMGSDNAFGGRHEDERLHKVTITKSYYLGKYEVTQEIWTKITGKKPFTFPNCGPKCPVESITWCDAVIFANLFSAQQKLDPVYSLKGQKTVFTVDMFGMDQMKCSGFAARVQANHNANGYRLPTEAEWVHAAKAKGKNRYAGSDNPDLVSWYRKTSNHRPHHIGKLQPNQWGLYDMTGNVWEWCWNNHAQHPEEDQIDPMGPKSGHSRLLKGGAWDFNAPGGRLDNRNRRGPYYKDYATGLRLARSVQSGKAK